MTLSKLSIRNARRQAGDYLVYFVTIVLVASLTYAFNGLVFSQELLALSRQMAMVPPMIVFASIVVVGIISWLVAYTTRFMLLRRSREFGTYILIGLENEQVARMFFLENLAVGGCALCLGILLGNLLYQALRAIVLALFGMSYHFSFFFSGKAVALTLTYFVLIYLSAQLKSRRKIRKMRIYDLIYLERQNEREVVKSGRGRRVLFAGSLVLGTLGTLLLLTGDLAACLTGACLVIFFLYGFFISFASGVPAFFEKRPARKYRGQRLLVFRTLTAKLGTMGVLMASLALLFLGTLAAEGMGMVFQGMFQSRTNKNNCFDLVLAAKDPKAESFRDSKAYIAEKFPLKEDREYEIYLLDTDKIMAYAEVQTMYYRYYGRDAVMKESDYRALRAMLGYEDVACKPGQYLIHCLPYMADALQGFSEELVFGDASLTPGGVHTEVFAQHLYDYGNGGDFILIVPDALLEGYPVSHTMYVAMTREPVSEAQYKGICTIRDQIFEEREDPLEDSLLYASDMDEAQAASQTAMSVFPLFYLALVLTMTAATILTIQQLGEAGRYRRQFALLWKLGMDKKEMGRALRAQFAIYYALPAIPPVLVGAPLIRNMASQVEPGTMVGASDPLAITAMALGLFFLIYGIYIALAYSSLKRSVLPE